jgi:polar amino acid transport system substrate-binding protein
MLASVARLPRGTDVGLAPDRKDGQRRRKPYDLRMRLRLLASTLAFPLLLGAAACAPAEEDDPTPTAEDTQGSDPSEEPTDEAAADDPAACAADKTQMAGMLMIGTDSPAYEPWFVDNDPTNGEGYESAVAYAVAEQLGFTGDAVSWVKVPFNTSYKPGPKEFDFDINQISITAARAEAVDFSDGYYQAAQAVIALDDSPAAGATTVAELADLKLGAQTGTTSLTAIRDVIQPTEDPAVFEDTNIAKQQLMSGQVDAILADLPTAFYITAVEIPKASIIGQFQPETGEQEEFGMLFEKGNPLVECVNLALAALEADGTIDALETEWLSDTVGVPELQ